MRKIRKTHKQLKLHHLIIIFVCTLLFISIGYSYLYANLSVTGKGNLVEKQDVTDNIEFTYTKDTWYNNGSYYYKYDMAVKNKTSEAINGWSIDITLPDEISEFSSWNVDASVTGKVITLSNLEYDALLEPNVSVTFGIMFCTSTENLELDDIKIFKDNNIGSGGGTGGGDNPTPGGKELDSSISLTNQWQDSSNNKQVFQYSVTLTNNNDSAISSWSFDLNVTGDTTILGMWSSNYIDKENGVITVSNKDWNGSIASGGNFVVDFQLTSSSQSINPVISNAKGN